MNATKKDWQEGKCLMIEKTFKDTRQPFEHEYWIDPDEAINRVIELCMLNAHPIIRCVTPFGLVIIQMNGLCESYRR